MRVGRVQDVDEAVNVWRRASRARRRGGAIPEKRESQVRRNLSQPTPLLVVAEDAGQIIGMALGMQGRSDDGSGPPIPELCHVAMVYVEPTRWGEGVGGLLVQALTSEAVNRGYARAQLWTHADNQRAQRLYERMGFARSGRAKLGDFGEEIVHFEIAALPAMRATG